MQKDARPKCDKQDSGKEICPEVIKLDYEQFTNLTKFKKIIFIQRTENMHDEEIINAIKKYIHEQRIACVFLNPDIDARELKYYNNEYALCFLEPNPFGRKNNIELIEEIQPQYIFHFVLCLSGLVTVSCCRYADNALTINRKRLRFSGLSTARERKLLYFLAKSLDVQGNILEIGSYTGGTSIAIAMGLRDADSLAKLFCVDINFLPEFDDFIREAGVSDLIIKTQMDSKEFAKSFQLIAHKHECVPKLKLLWIDGAHSYEACKSDLENFIPYLSDGGIVVVHDYTTDEVHSGVVTACNEELRSNKEFGNFGQIDSIFYAEKNRIKKFLNFPYYLSEGVKNKFNNISNVVDHVLSAIDITPRTIIYLYCCGDFTFRFLSFCKEKNMMHLLDCIHGIIDDFKDDCEFSDIPVVKIERVINDRYDYIIPLTYRYEPMIIDKLYKKGVPMEKIIRINTAGDPSQESATGVIFDDALFQ